MKMFEMSELEVLTKKLTFPERPHFVGKQEEEIQKPSEEGKC